jgi:transcriptional regulator with XRE-family HTH domain
MSSIYCIDNVLSFNNMFNDNLKEQIKNKNLLIKELSSMTGISKRTLDTYLDKREVIPNAVTAYQLAQALDTTVEFLVTGKKESSSLGEGRLRNITEDLLTLSDETQEFIRIIVHALAESAKKGS